MRIALLTLAVPWEDRPTNGLYNIAQCRAINELGHDARVFSCAPKLPRFMERFSALARRQRHRPARCCIDEVYIHTARVLFGYSRWVREWVAPRFPKCVQRLFSSAAKKPVGKMLDHYQPDVLIVHGLFPWGHFAIEYARSRSIPIVVIEHSQTDQDRVCQVRAYRRAYRALGRQCEHLFGVNDRMCTQLRGIGLDHVTTLLNGIEQIEPLKDQEVGVVELGDRDPGFEVLIVGQYIERKGHRYVLEALVDPRLSDVRVTLVGKPSPTIVHLIEKLDLGHRVRLLPVMTPSELREEMRAADLFVLPSWGESFGLVYLESISAGTPIVLCNDSGASEIECVRNAGWIVPPRDSSAIADAISSAMGQSKDDLDELVSAASSWIRTRATWEENAKCLSHVLEGIRSQAAQ